MSEEPACPGLEDQTAVPPARRRPANHGTAIDLLEKVLKLKGHRIEDIADALIAQVSLIKAYRDGRMAMPLERQALFAAYVIERAPKYARLGRRLRGQVQAAIMFSSGETQTHLGPPPSGRW